MIKYPYVMFDWGDTIMRDDPAMTTPMAQWPTVAAVEGTEETLKAIHRQRKIIMATGAVQSNEADIRFALQRVNLANYFDRIFCFKNTGLRKPSEEFYRHILETIQAQPSDLLMVGDNFESDVLAANRVGIPAMWLNAKDATERQGAQYWTIHRLQELLLFLEDQQRNPAST